MKIAKMFKTALQQALSMFVVRKRFIKRWLFFKPLYKIQMLIDPNSMFPIAKPRFPKYSRFVYMVCKWSL